MLLRALAAVQGEGAALALGERGPDTASLTFLRAALATDAELVRAGGQGHDVLAMVEYHFLGLKYSCFLGVATHEVSKCEARGLYGVGEQGRGWGPAGLVRSRFHQCKRPRQCFLKNGICSSFHDDGSTCWGRCGTDVYQRAAPCKRNPFPHTPPPPFLPTPLTQFPHVTRKPPFPSGWRVKATERDVELACRVMGSLGEATATSIATETAVLRALAAAIDSCLAAFPTTLDQVGVQGTGNVAPCTYTQTLGYRKLFTGRRPKGVDDEGRVVATAAPPRLLYWYAVVTC